MLDNRRIRSGLYAVSVNIGTMRFCGILGAVFTVNC